MKTKKRLEEGYREMARDTEREREAADWCDALIGHSSEAVEEWFRKLDELNSEPFPARRKSAKRDVFE